jgi:GNAT superfamily N-acetyltransferase
VTARTAPSFSIRSARAGDVRPLAKLWHDGWYVAHGALVPEALKAKRTPEYFLNAMAEEWGGVRLAQSGHTILGFHLTKAPVVDLLFVAPDRHGCGVGAELLADAEMVLTTTGVAVATLDCLATNSRACAFYERNGWRAVRPVIDTVPTPDGPVDVTSTLYEKHLGFAR